MMEIRLPAEAKENALRTILPSLNQVDDDDNEFVELDFSQLAFYRPPAVVALLARCRYWATRGKRVLIKGHTTCPASRYLQRIDFFNQLGVDLVEEFTRHPVQGRFVPIRRVSDGRQVDSIAREVSKCAAGSNPDLQECLKYAIGEILTNVAQHSQGEGFVCVQTYQGGRVELAVADTGVGLRRSFEGTSLEAELDDDKKALVKAMEPEVSSALLRPPSGPYGQYVNRGIGLSMVSEIARQTCGVMKVVTGNAQFHRRGDVRAEFSEDQQLVNQGVLVSLSLNPDEIDDFQQIIESVRNVVTPSELDNWDEMFD
jgi:hypothetical protein